MTTMLFQGPNFTLQVPTDWLITATPHVQTVFLAPETPGAVVRPSLAISLSAISDSATVVDIANVIVRTQSETYPAYSLSANTQLDISGQPGVELRSTWKNEAQVTVEQTQRLVRANDWVHSLTATCAVDRAPVVAETLRAMLESFHLNAVS